MSKKLLRCLLSLVLVVLLSSMVTVEASAASYPLVILNRDDSNLVVPEKYAGLLSFTVFPEYKNERLVVNFYDSDGNKVANSTKSLYNSSILYKDVIITFATGTLGMEPGAYTVEYYMEFYTLYAWHTAPKKYTVTLKVVEDTCLGDHSFTSKVIDEGDCDTKVKTRLECSKCGHSKFEYGEYVHTYDEGTVSVVPTTTQDGTIVFTCTECAETKTTTIPAAGAARITKQPKDVAAKSGETAAVTVKATGHGLKYTWYVKDAGATEFTQSSVRKNTYSVSMNSTRNGRQVYCKVTDKYGYSVVSDTVTLKIPTALKITKQPTSTGAFSGKQASVSVTAQGDGLTYLWYYKNAGGSAFTKSTVKTATYSVGMNSSRSGRQVYCKITDEYGNTINTNTVTLTLQKPAKITKQPVSVTAAGGAKASVTVTATGDGLKYAWYVKDAGASSFTLSSIKTKTYSVTMNAERDGRQAYCVVTDKYGNSVQSNTVTMAKPKYAKITKQPESVLVESGAAATVTVTATGDGLKYAWYVKDAGASSFTLSSVKTNKYSVTMNSSRDGRQLYCKVTDQYGKSVQSNTVTLNQKNTVKITKQPVSVSVFSGETATVSVTATGDGLTYLWGYMNPGDTEVSFSSVKTNKYSVTMNSTRDGRTLVCMVTDKYGNQEVSAAAQIIMKKNVKITSQPATVAVPEGETAAVSVTATGDGLTYAWYFKDAGSSGFSRSSVKTSTYSVEMNDSRNNRQVYCVVTDQYGKSEKSSTATLIKKTPLTLSLSPGSATIYHPHDYVFLWAHATGDDVTYAWSYVDDNSGEEVDMGYTTYDITVSGYGQFSWRTVYCTVTDKYGETRKAMADVYYLGD